MDPKRLPTTVALGLVLLTSAPARGQHVTFTAATNTIQVPGNTVVGSELTIEALISVQSPAGGVVFNEQLDGFEDKQLVLALTALHGAAWRGPSYPGSLAGGAIWNPCEWVHVAFVVEGNEERIYIDGVRTGLRTVSGAVQNFSPSAMSIGAFQPISGSLRPSMRGSIDWLRVSDVARYAGIFSPPPLVEPDPDAGTLLLYYFNEAAGATTVADQGPNGWNGILGTGFTGASSPVLGPQASVGSYCTPGTSASGCQALICAAGVASASASSGFTLIASNVEGNKDGLFFFGTNGPQANPWGNGSSFQCVTPPVKRGGILSGVGTSGACDGAFSQDLNALWQASPTKNPGAGALVQAQLWYRDPLNTSNQTTSLSDATEFAVSP